ENRRKDEVVRLLVDGWLLISGSMIVDGREEPCIEPAHDALVRGWDLLSKWIERKQRLRSALTLQPRLTQAVNDWRRRADAAKDEALWHNNPQLAAAEEAYGSRDSWLNKREREFVRLSVAQRDRIRRRRQGLATAAVAVSLIVAAVMTALFLINRART